MHGQAGVQVNGHPWASSQQVPKRLLHPSVQGILTSEHACKIAREIVDPAGELAASGATFTIDAFRVQGDAEISWWRKAGDSSRT